MKRLVEWNCKEKNSALPVAINEFGDTYSTEEICAQLAVLYDIIGDCDLDRLRKLVEADRDGRCVVLPVKPGDKIWQIYSWGIEERIIDKILVAPTGLSYEFWISDFGMYRTSPGEAVFFTREEAEAALAKRKEN